MSSRTIFLCLFATALFTLQVGYSYLSESAAEKYSVLSDQEYKAILAGADPSELLDATATGGNKKSQAPPDIHKCQTGKVVSEVEEPLNDKYYVSYPQGNINYIQVSPWIPIYLEQAPLQIVSAHYTTPSKNIRDKLSDHFAHREDCIKSDLYLSRIDKKFEG